VGAQGLASLVHYSTLRNDIELTSYLNENHGAVHVHIDCRKKYTCKCRFEQEQRAEVNTSDASGPSKCLRSGFVSPFDWKAHCMLCGESAQFDSKHPSQCSIIAVQTLGIRDTVLEYCLKRNDEWALEVQSRLNTCHDLVAVEAVYHWRCYSAFRKMSARPTDGIDRADVGRPVDEKKTAGV